VDVIADMPMNFHAVLSAVATFDATGFILLSNIEAAVSRKLGARWAYGQSSRYEG